MQPIRATYLMADRKLSETKRKGTESRYSHGLTSGDQLDSASESF